jgi:sugar transferase (PEP-CTERM/EpsH1 system associated)
MDVLYVVPYVPSLIRIRPYNFIRILTSRGHRITLAVLWSNLDERAGIGDLAQCCKAIIDFQMPAWKSLLNSAIALPTGQPLQAWYSWDRKIARAINTLVADPAGQYQFDVIHIEHLRGVKYGLYLQAMQGKRITAGLRKPSFVWDSVDCISYLFRQSAAYSKTFIHRLITQFDLRRTETYERELLGRFPKILITSNQDKQAYLALDQSDRHAERLKVVPNGVDVDYFQPNGSLQRETATVVLSGKMSYHANITMAIYLMEQIMPIVWAQKPDTKVWIVGKDPAKEVRDFAGNPNVTVTGTVPDIRPYLQRATAAVVPMVYGAGIQNKVLESMACGTPVVATPKAIAAIPAAPNREILVAEKPDEFARKVIYLLENPAAAASIGKAGREFILQNYHWDRIADVLEEVYYGIN